MSARAAPPLDERCLDAAACWASLPDAARPRTGERWGFARDMPGCMLWPWIGERYTPGGVAIPERGML